MYFICLLIKYFNIFFKIKKNMESSNNNGKPLLKNVKKNEAIISPP